MNNFEHANELLEGQNVHAQQFGTINYYDDTEILEWSEQMLKMELKVSELKVYKAIVFFHHVILRNK